MRRTLIVCVLLLAGCSRVTVVSPCDAGPSSSDAGELADVGPGDGGAADAYVLTSVEACGLIESVTPHVQPCPYACPWQGVSGPGTPAQTCDTDVVALCLSYVSRINTCEWLEPTIAEHCPADACR